MFGKEDYIMYEKLLKEHDKMHSISEKEQTQACINGYMLKCIARLTNQIKELKKKGGKK